MWESIFDFMKTNNGMLTFIVALAAVFFFVKKGWLEVASNHIKVGSTGETERKILKDQYEWTIHFIHSLEAPIKDKIGNMEGYSDLRTKLVLEKLIDEVGRWIMLNHITESPTYVETKKDIIYSIIMEGSAFPDTVNEEMRKVYNEWTEEVIKKLVSIREYYEK